MQKSQLLRCVSLLTRVDQKKLLFAVLLQISMSMLDLFGVLAIGILGAISVTGLQSIQPGNRINTALTYLHINHLTFEQQATILGLGALILLVLRTVASVIFTRKILFFLSRRGAQISANLLARLLSQQLIVIQSRTSQEMLYAVTRGVSLITLQVLATATVIISDSSLLFVLAVGLFFVDPVTAIGIFSLFILIAYFLYRFMHVPSRILLAMKK